MGEDAPIATWRGLLNRPAMTSGSNSASRKDCKASRGALGIYVPIEISGKSIGARGHPRVFAKMRRIRAVVVGKRQRPRPIRHKRDRFDVKPAKGASREQVIVEQTSVVKLFHRHHRLRAAAGHGAKPPIPPHPTIPLPAA